MKKSYYNLIILATLFILISNFAFSQKAKYTISGVIKDNNSTIMKDVAVYISGGRTDITVTDANGLYKFENLDSGSTYLIYPIKDGYVFSPVSRSIEKIKENITQNFTASPKSYYTISGYIKQENGSPVRGVTINVITIISSKFWTAETDSTGFYKLVGLDNGITYALVPIKAGYSFNPATATFENLSENKTQNFKAITSPVYSIGGTVKTSTGIPIAGVTIVLTGEKQMKVIADSLTGAYKFENLPSARSYSVYASKTGLVFDPAIKTFDSLNENKILNFVGSAPKKYTISGYVKDINSKPIGGATITLIGGSLISATPVVKEIKAVSDSVTGFYKFENIESGFYTLVPAKGNYTFDPKSAVFDNLSENKTQNFTGSLLQTYTIKGVIKDKNSNPLGGVTVALIGAVNIKVVTDSLTGSYRFENLEAGKFYTVSASKNGYNFDPRIAQIDNLTGNVTQNFIGTPVSLLTISGYIKDKSSVGISGVTITLTGEKQAKVTTDSEGFYKIENLEANKFYAILPSGSGYSYDPKVKSFDPLTENKTQDFVATPVPLYTIDGFVKDSTSSAVPSVTMSLAGGRELKSQTDSSGYYKFDKLEAGKLYLLVPSKRGLAFNPKYQVFENLSSNMTQNFKASKISSSILFNISGATNDFLDQTAQSYSIMGFVQDINSSFVGGVTLILNGDEQIKIQTDQNGFYTFDNLNEGRQYTLTAQKADYVFDPAGVTFDDLGENQAQFLLSDYFSVTDVKDRSDIIPKVVSLYQNYPNPFNPNTIVKYELPTARKIKIQVYDIIGRLVTTLYDDYQAAGVHEVNFSGAKLSSGNYFVKLDAGDAIRTIRVMLIK